MVPTDVGPAERDNRKEFRPSVDGLRQERVMRPCLILPSQNFCLRSASRKAKANPAGGDIDLRGPEGTERLGGTRLGDCSSLWHLWEQTCRDEPGFDTELIAPVCCVLRPSIAN